MKYLDIVFDGPPGPEGGRFVEVEDERGHSISVGEWLERLGGWHVLRLPRTLDLNELLVTQALLQERMGHPTGHSEAGAKENLLHAVIETVEALRELNFKPWKTQRKDVDLKAFATELTDIMQFVANAALAMGLSADDLADALRAKWEVNHKRIKNQEVTSS